jgi:hypothetical protein
MCVLTECFSKRENLQRAYYVLMLEVQKGIKTINVFEEQEM